MVAPALCNCQRLQSGANCRCRYVPNFAVRVWGSLLLLAGGRSKSQLVLPQQASALVESACRGMGNVAADHRACLAAHI